MTSFSGHERNHVFTNQKGQKFEDTSALSGLGANQDSRALAILDLNRDGWSDVALVNNNAPTLALYQNQGNSGNNSVALQLQGGNKGDAQTSEWSSRDGIGAEVEFKSGELKRLHPWNLWHGHASQNSGTTLLGLGRNENVEELLVRWPSGKTSRYSGQPIPAGSQVRVYENPQDSPSKKAFVVGEYHKIKSTLAAPGALVRLEGFQPEGPTLLVTMSTTCDSCRRELPQLAHLRGAFKDGELHMVGLSLAAGDTPEKLREYQDKFQPSYRILSEPSKTLTESVKKNVQSALGSLATPNCILLNREGQIVACFPGIPTVSALRRAQRDPAFEPAYRPAPASRPPVASYSHPQARVTDEDVRKILVGSAKSL